MKKRNVLLSLAIAIVLIVFASGIILSSGSKAKGPHNEYQCDVKTISLSTKIDIKKDNEDFAFVKGNLFKFITDPLTLYDENDNEVAYAGDDYHFISQDSHSITVNGILTAEMVGLVDFFGESYDIYDSEGEQIAEVSFNMFNTIGEMYDMDGTLIADFNSKLFFNDFDVRIYENCEIDEYTVLMIFSSYYSDQKYDSNSK